MNRHYFFQGLTVSKRNRRPIRFDATGWAFLFDTLLREQELSERSERDGHVNATNTMKLTRGRWLDLFADYNARIEIVYLEPPLDNVLRQNKARVNSVPEQVIRKLADKCEPPTCLECHALMVEDFSG